MSALPRRGGALPGDPTIPERAPRDAPASARAPPTDTSTTNTAKNAAPENADMALPANARPDRVVPIGEALAVASSDPDPAAGALASAVPDGPRPTSRSQCSR
ncbi:hypothetical protein, partial [Rhodococcus sp. 05-2254-6]|uniref:hypothetical protein n=1 Tax=Rhodococcus sp. 05-2254-6 TaxID=2022489 RepID=UPI001C52D01E